jgi:methyl-accepting chemotaxis protein
MERDMPIAGVIEFSTDGTILWANERFLAVTGYRLDEIAGRHHRMFCTREHVAAPDYDAFWSKLGRGEFDAGEYKRLGKDGREIWLQATYNPVFDADGVARRILKIASDITSTKLRGAEAAGKIAAIDRSLATIEFALDGTIIDANENFLACVGYAREEIVGRHHNMFCDQRTAASAEYRAFWAKLGTGAFDAGVYRRKARDGRDVWLQATYNPILGPEGRPLKIVKFATDITEDKRRDAVFEGKVNAIERSQAVVEFDLEGHVLEANANFLDAFGYDREAVVGRHHRRLCDPRSTGSVEYRNFWERLGRGEYDAGRYRRYGEGGREV